MPHVLVIDDQAQVREIVRLGLEQDGDYRVSEAGSKEEADAIFTGDKPDVAIIDVVLRGMSGVEIAKCAARQGVAVLLMTGKPISSDERASYGFPCVSKPFRLSDLLAQTREIVARTARDATGS
jgi:two-component system OmpR family response regulator